MEYKEDRKYILETLKDIKEDCGKSLALNRGNLEKIHKVDTKYEKRMSKVETKLSVYATFFGIIGSVIGVYLKKLFNSGG